MYREYVLFVINQYSLQDNSYQHYDLKYIIVIAIKLLCIDLWEALLSMFPSNSKYSHMGTLCILPFLLFPSRILQFAL